MIICDTAPLAAALFRDPGYGCIAVLVEQYADLPLARHAPTLTLLPEPGRRP